MTDKIKKQLLADYTTLLFDIRTMKKAGLFILCVLRIIRLYQRKRL
jgi:hypothetical protein